MPKGTEHPHALLLRPDSTFEVLDWPSSGSGLPTLYRAIECTAVDVVRITPELDMWLNDEGMIDGTPINRWATAVYAAHRPPHQWYHGNVVLTGGADSHGNTIGLTDQQVIDLTADHLDIAISLMAVKIPTQRTKK
ncbi:hypothetical protein C6N75_11755 [Streptomyces solincola]|uniref:DUF3846 domain-containing protein n=1 Tax=Streptomyces solincola TaxID=2100817 RepID=A0A2S9PXH2_9ACTN|nr:DUF3846 domain-containing protein [Streptomyces solincola]PRH79037.1 hypothetical protein C6N75_11755 [Streptomyces solincola]